MENTNFKIKQQLKAVKDKFDQQKKYNITLLKKMDGVKVEKLDIERKITEGDANKKFNLHSKGT